MAQTKRATAYLDVGFEGYFACRIATDPDPTDERRGMSGYTMALAGEDPLDQGIRLQVDDAYYQRNGRAPMRQMGIEIGVSVTSVRCAGKPWPRAAGLIGAKVHLDGGDDPAAGLPLPIFESRNNITGSDDTMSFVITPFRLRIENGAQTLTAIDYVDPRDPSRQPWQIDDPAVYERRLTRCWATDDQCVAEAIGVFDAYGYFRDRRRYLERLIEHAQAEIANLPAKSPEAAALEANIQRFRSRIYQLEFWGDRVISKLLMRCNWQFDINGPKAFGFDVGVAVDTSADWPIELWFGGWDGDLLLGYAQGTLRLPFALTADIQARIDAA